MGQIYSLNTLGAILGAFAGGFVLLAFLGIRDSILVAICLNLSGAALVLAAATPSAATRLTGCLALLLMTASFLAAPPGWNPLLMSSGMYQYAADLKKGFSEAEFQQFTEGNYQLLFYQEGINTTVAVLSQEPNILLVNNGKIDASNRADLPTQLLFGHLPLLFHSSPQDVCLIGVGSGITAGSVLRHPIRSLVLLEIESAVVKASRYFDDVNHRPLLDPRTELMVADGRTYLTFTDRQFDVIISEPSNPWMTGVSNLFTQEFFLTCRKKLRPGGILAQWVQLYGMPLEDLKSMLATLLSVFPHVQVFCSIEESDLIIIASESPLPLDVSALMDRIGEEKVIADLARVKVHHMADLLSYFKIGELEIRAFASDSILNTDDNAHIEFSAPLHLASTTRKTNRQMLDRATAGPLPYLVGLDDPEIRARFLNSLEDAYRRRQKPREADLVAKARSELPQVLP